MAILDRELTDEELERALIRARDKLSFIIKNEGDADGQRLEPWYISRLLEEAIREQRGIF